MRRREYLATGSSLAAFGFAGCSSSAPTTETNTTESDTATDTATATATDTETETATATPPSFEVQEISMPDGVPVGDMLPVEFTVRNTGEKGAFWMGTFEFAYTRGPEPDDWTDIAPEVFVAGESTTTETIEFNPFESPGVFYARFDDDRVETIHSPLSKAPIVEEVNLVSEWESFGDGVENRVQSANAGEGIPIVTRYWEYMENQTHHTRTQMRVYDMESEDRVGIESYTANKISDAAGWGQWENAIHFDTQGWGTGEYRAEVLVRDEQNSEVSEEGTVTFELT